MTESLEETGSAAVHQHAIDIHKDTFMVDAALAGELLHLPVSQVPIPMRLGRITSRCERAVDQHDGEFRLNFFYGNRRARLSTDVKGRILRKSAIDFGERPIPDARGRAMAVHEGDLIDQDL